ncbi:MAG: hypothetical protein LBG70_01115 [Bifidobacteriaceae bacterium]|jgi:putative peptidoglycan lipid II flippase|nr:hypothetical protein [Bifidobacteriaceae bacterium]
MNQSTARHLLTSAALISIITVAARLAGLLRWAVFAPTVGATATGQAYTTANAVPNLIFEVVIGGGLAVVLVPLLAGHLAERRGDQAGQIASSLLCWTLLILSPLAIILACLAGPLATWLLAEATTNLNDAAQNQAIHQLGTQLLRIFAPQLPLYGIGVVLSGYLQAGRRFAWPALAPLMSSLVVIGAYFGFANFAEGAQASPARLSNAAVACLGWGTTLGVAALTLPLLIPARRLGLPWRCSLRLPPGVGRRTLGLAASGMGGLLAQQVAMLVTMVLANRLGGHSAWPAWQYLQAIYLLPFAVLVMPLATTAFTELAAQGSDAIRQTAPLAAVARSGRLVLGASIAGAAVLLAAASPLAQLLQLLDRSASFPNLTTPIRVLGLALIGLSVMTQANRALVAAERPGAAVRGMITGWLTVAVSGIIICLLVGAIANRAASVTQTLIGLASAWALGMAVGGGSALKLVNKILGPAALHGLGRTAGLAMLGAVAAALAGSALSGAIIADQAGGLLRPILACLASGLVALALVAGPVGLAEPQRPSWRPW